MRLHLIYKKYFSSILITISYLAIVFVFRNNSIWGINDDYVLNSIINNSSDLQNSIVSFMSLVLGFLLAILFKLTNHSNWLGITLTIGNLLFVLISVFIIKKFKYLITRYIGFLLISFLIPYLILRPTYTITSILLTFSGLFYFLHLVKIKEKKYRYFLFAGLIATFGISIRMDSLKGSILFLGLYLIIFLIIFKNFNLLKKISIFLIPIFILIISQNIIYQKVSSQNLNTSEYLKFQNLRHELFYTPAFLKMHQKVIAGEVNQDKWANVEMILFRNWVYPDQNIYNSATLQIGKKSVESYMGLTGVLNSDLTQTFETIIYYLDDVKIFLYISILLILFSIVASKNYKYSLLLNFSLLFSYLIGFYYAAAVLRIPIRVSLPYLVIFSILVIFNLELTQLNSKLNLKSKSFSLVFSILFISLFNWYSNFGFKFLALENQSKLNFSIQRNLELSNLNENALYISTINYIPSSNSGPFNKAFDSENRILSLDWSTFSPSWKMKALTLGLNPKNIYLDLAKTKNVYFISNPELADLADMYMNDHNILRGKKCLVQKLTGVDDAGVYTYQAPENSC